jgi:GTP cyclohydrolase I
MKRDYPKFGDIINFIEEWAPLELACEWDNSGLQIGNSDKNVKNILLALDINKDVLAFIEKNQVDLIITHHPLIFNSINKIDFDTALGNIINLLIKKDICLYSAHTNLDFTAGGVNDALIKAFGFDPETGFDIRVNQGKWFENNSNLSLEKIINNFDGKLLNNSSNTNRIAFACGSGKSILNNLVDLKIDLFISGELSYHDELFCELNNISCFLLGHKESEQFILNEIEERIKANFLTNSITILNN